MAGASAGGFAPPPPIGAIDPIFETLAAGIVIERIYNPAKHGATATGYRYAGPLVRMDHQVAGGTDRGILYAAPTYSGCLIEVCDGPLLAIGTRRHVTLRLTTNLTVLDLRRNGAVRAGTDARIGKCAHDDSQPWARHFYDDAAYRDVGSLWWLNSHNDDEAFAFFERAGAAFHVEKDVPLTSELNEIARLLKPMNKTIDFTTVPR